MSGRRHTSRNCSALFARATRFASLLVALVLILGQSPGLAATVRLKVHANKPAKRISVGIYGQFLEHIFHSVHGGLWGDQILNGTFELAPQRQSGGGTSTGAQASLSSPAGTGSQGNPPRGWMFLPGDGAVRNDPDNALNAANSIRLEAASESTGRKSAVRQRDIALKQGERYTFTVYARGSGELVVEVSEENNILAGKTFSGVTQEWQKLTFEFVAPKSANAVDLDVSVAAGGRINVDQASLFSAAAMANHGLRPDLYQAIADLRPASIRWPGGSFANNYIWENCVGPLNKRLPHPIEQWNDRDPNHFGTDEFIQMCERLGCEPILVLNTRRPVQEAINWLEYCVGDSSTPMGKLRARNGREKPYTLQTVEIDNETWLLMPYEDYLKVVNEFVPAIRARFPGLKISVVGSYAFDTGPGEGRPEWNNVNWDPRLIRDAAARFDILSPHYYNGLLREHPPDYKDDPRRYEEFLVQRGELIRKSANPNIKIYVSEWNLTHGRWGNDWRIGLYAGGILNSLERQGDLVTMSCPALFLRHLGARSWDNALINFNQNGWFPGGNYTVMKLWRDSFGPNLLRLEGSDKPLNIVATATDEGDTVYVKIVNPDSESHEALLTMGRFAARSASFQLIAPGSETAKNSLERPNTLSPARAPVKLSGNTVSVALPAWSAGVIQLSRRK